MNMNESNKLFPFPVGVIGITPKGIVFYANQVALNLFNMELLDKPWSEILDNFIQATENPTLFKINSQEKKLEKV